MKYFSYFISFPINRSYKCWRKLGCDQYDLSIQTDWISWIFKTKVSLNDNYLNFKSLWIWFSRAQNILLILYLFPLIGAINAGENLIVISMIWASTRIGSLESSRQKYHLMIIIWLVWIFSKSLNFSKSILNLPKQPRIKGSNIFSHV